MLFDVGGACLLLKRDRSTFTDAFVLRVRAKGGHEREDYEPRSIHRLPRLHLLTPSRYLFQAIDPIGSIPDTIRRIPRQALSPPRSCSYVR